MNDNRREATVTIDGRHAAIAVFVSCLLIELGLVLLDYVVNYGRMSQSAAVRRFANIAREPRRSCTALTAAENATSLLGRSGVAVMARLVDCAVNVAREACNCK